MTSSVLTATSGTEPPSKKKILAAVQETTKYLSKKDYGIKFKLKGAELRRAHKKYRAEFGMATHSDAFAVGRENKAFLSKRDYGIKFKLKGARLRRAHELYRKQFCKAGSPGLSDRPKRPASNLQTICSPNHVGEKNREKRNVSRPKRTNKSLWMIYSAFESNRRRH